MSPARRSVESSSPLFIAKGRPRGAKRPDVGRSRARTPAVWSLDEEIALAHAIADAREALWRCLLADPARVVAVRTAAELPENEAVDALARRLADADRDLELAGALVRMLEASPEGADAAPDRARVLAAWRALQALRHRFTEANVRLVGAMTRRFLGRGMDADELAQEGCMGLLRAVDRYDHRLGFRFSTYAVWWVRHAMERAIRNRGNVVRIPVPTQDALFRLHRTRAEAARRDGRAPTESELAEAGLAPAAVRRLDRVAALTTVVPLHAATSSGEGSRAPVVADDSESAEDLLGLQELKALATAMLSHLRPREAEVLRRRFGLQGDEETLAEIGASLHMSRERVRQIQNVALERMRSLMKRRDPELELPAAPPIRRLAS